MRYFTLLLCWMLSLNILVNADDQEVKSNDSAPKIETASFALSSYPSALEKAKKENKSVFMLFTGKDWCPPCQELAKTILTTPTFKTFMDKEMVFLELDYPQGDTTPENQQLAMDYGVEAFPTILIVDETGIPFQRFGFQGQSPEEFVEALKACLKQKGFKAKYLSAKTDKEKDAIIEEFEKSRTDGESTYYYADLVAQVILKDQKLEAKAKVEQIGELYINVRDAAFSKWARAALEKLDPKNELATDTLFTVKDFVDAIVVDNDNDKAYDIFVKKKEKFKGQDLGYLYQFAMRSQESGKPERSIAILEYILKDDMIKDNESARTQIEGLISQLKAGVGQVGAPKIQETPAVEEAPAAQGAPVAPVLKEQPKEAQPKEN